MYPRNAASPEPIAIGAVVQISDGAVQTSGVTVRIKPVGVAEGNGAGTTAYSTDGVVLYTPTQAETNYTSFVLIASKTGCIPASQTVITSESTTAGRVYVATNGDKTGYSLSASGLSLVTSWAVAITGNITGNLSGSVGSVTGNVTGSVGSISGVTFPTHFQNMQIAANGHVSAVVEAIANNSITASSIQGGAITAAKFASGAIDANALAADAVAEIRTGFGLASGNLDTQLASLGTIDNQRYLLAILAGTCSTAATAGETYTITFSGSTYTVTFAGLDSVGNRGTAAFAKT